MIACCFSRSIVRYSSFTMIFVKFLLALLLTAPLKSNADGTESSRTESVHSDGALTEEHIASIMMDWLVERGVTGLTPNSPLQIVVGKPRGNRGLSRTRRGLSVVAARDLVEGEPLFSLPPSAFISPEQLITLPHPYPLTPDISPLSGWPAFSILAAWIIREKRKVESGEGSQWGVYVRSLPAYVPLPVFYPDDLIQEFELQSMIDHLRCLSYVLLPSPFSPRALPFPLLLQSVSYREAFKSEYARCDKAAIGNATCLSNTLTIPPLFPHLSPQAFSYRETFKAEYDKCDKAAIGNASEEEFMWAVATDEQTDTIVVRSYTALPAGSQLYNSYGTKSTDMFLQAYGFVPSENPHDSFPLTSSEADLAEIYYKHYANVTVKEGRKGMFDLWAEYLLRRATEDVRAAKEKVEEEVGVITGPKADVFGEGSEHAVWAGGQVDPRMLMFLASLWHVFGYGEGAL
ncbi:unnamed protein product [Closterium sp. Yama58-4]|nr:unnamed protein product [Closterium sp. Yama58-4]